VIGAVSWLAWLVNLVYALAQLNPYESPSTASSRTESPSVASNVSVVWFTVAGLISGSISAISIAVPPVGLFVPPLVFGIALSLAKGCRDWAVATLVAGCCGAWIVSLVVGALSIAMEHFPPARGFCSGFVCGAVGSLIIVGVYQVISPAARTLGCIALVGSSGALIAGVSVSIGIHFADHSRPPNHTPFLLLFPLWQAGVALCLAISERFVPSRT
jgi:uncharacterized membrane protein YeaQ/YmgE (transglycosylase-associated protein family)